MADGQRIVDSVVGDLHDIRVQVVAVRTVLPEGSESLRDLDHIDKATQTLETLMRGFQETPGTLSKMRHDLRTPLNHIIGYGEMVLADAEDYGLERVGQQVGPVIDLGRQVLSRIDSVVHALTPTAPAPCEPTVTPVQTTPQQGMQGGRLLVVDDNPVNRDLLCRRLNKQGHHVETATNGQEALLRLAVEDFDLVLLDIMMPEVDGFQVLRTMKADDRLRHIPAVMISSLSEVPSIVKCIELGADDYLTKPFDSTLLRARIGACLEKKALRDREVQVMGALEVERRRANDLLRVILPGPIVDELQLTSQVKPRRYERVAVLFCDIVGFTEYCDKREPEEVLPALQRLVEAYEDLMQVHHMQKIKTIGDSFMAACGLLTPVDNPVLASVDCALDMIRLANELQTGWGVRVGVAIGPVVAGVLGHQSFQFDLWGDTVNTASRVEALGREGTVTVSEDAWEWLRDVPGIQGESCGRVPMKGKGLVELYRVTRVTGGTLSLQDSVIG